MYIVGWKPVKRSRSVFQKIRYQAKIYVLKALEKKMYKHVSRVYFWTRAWDMYHTHLSKL